MTFEERVTALAPLGFTPRQTRFLVTAALHGGYCLRRQYQAFGGLSHGQQVNDFFETLVRRELARSFRYQLKPWARLSPARQVALPGARAA